MVEINRIVYPQLDKGIQFRLNKISRVTGCFMAEIHEKDAISKTLSKYTAAFD